MASRTTDAKASTSKTDSKETSETKTRHCSYCLKEFGGYSSCGKCHKRAYCSKDCQRYDWCPNADGQGHKVNNPRAKGLFRRAAAA